LGGALQAKETTVEPQMQVETRGGTLYMEASIAGPYTRQEAWDLLTDYDRIAEFVSSMDSSFVVGHSDSSVIVRQVFTSRLIIPWTFSFTLEFIQDGPYRLRFRQLKGNMRHYEGIWEVQKARDGMRLVYTARAGHGLRLPGFVLRYIARRQIKALMPAHMVELTQRYGPR
jgi:hypothetical protein